jgi:hypothetical protein
LSRNNKILLVPFFILFIVFLMGVVKLFQLRFEAGDVYPAYSSLRSDPLGVKGFFKSLENLGPITVERNYRPLSRLHSGQGKTFFYLGVRGYQLESIPEKSLKTFNQLVTTGGRLVISFFPAGERPPSKNRDESCDPCAEKQKGQDEKEGADVSSKPATENEESRSSQGETSKKETHEQDAALSGMGSKLVSLPERWGVGFRYNGKIGDSQYAERALKSHGRALPKIVPWHSGVYFDTAHSSWRVIYARDGHPVIIERGFGTGTVVLSADSYLFSNEALMVERHPRFLAWLVGKNGHVVFDESHVGIQKSLGIVGLARKYRLHWLFVGIVLMALLFVWKNSVVFVPPLDDDSSERGYDFTSDRDYTEGLVSMLRRNVPARDILRVCVREWEKSLAPDHPVSNDRIKRVKAVIEAELPKSGRQDDPIRGYQTIRQILSKRSES